MNGRFQTALHILTLLEYNEGKSLSSDYIAGSLNINPVLVRKEISNLKAQGMITSREGKSGGYQLSKSASQITLADIYRAVTENPILGKARNSPNPACPIGRNIQQYLGDLSGRLDETLFKQLGNITLSAFSKQFN